VEQKRIDGMQRMNGRIIRAALFMLLIVHLSCAGRSAGAPDNLLLTIDGDSFTTDDFLTWWANILEPDMEPPETPQPFIDWTLLYREAESMGLHDDQALMKKVSTFHKVRSLMLLKSEEVDARISITEEEIRQHYAENYVPVWVLRILHFADGEKAEAAWRKLKSGEITEEELARKAPEEGGPLARNIVRQRPNSTHVEWLEIVRPLEINGYSEPVPWKGDFVLLHLLEKREDDENEFDSFREEIRHRLWKQQQGRYTFALLEKLKKKYQVEIHSDVVEQIDQGSLDGPFGDRPVVTTAIGNISESDFVAMLRKEVQFRKTSGFADDADFDLKHYVLNGIINQTLTSHEALERRYEQRPPYDKIYEYYVRHRLVKALEAHVFEPEVRIAPEEVTAYYENHTDEFTTPETVTLGIIEGDEDELRALWTDIVAGADDFMIMARINAPPGTKPVVEMAVEELEPEIARVVSGLAPGDVSRVVRVKDKFVLVQLLERTKSVTAPQEKAGRMIITDLRARRLEEVRNKYLAQLRAASDIQVNEKAWRNLRERISGNNEKTK
jgi:parvulin-like peptidyl-prolyl isomerase